jgi:hypothetical protein
LVLSAFCVSSALAAFAWHTCTISLAGSITGSEFVEVTGTGGDTTPTIQFLIVNADPGVKKEMLAAALTSWANAGNVWVYCDPSLGAYSPAYGLASIK